VSLSDKILNATGAIPRKGSDVDRQRARTGIGKSSEFLRVQGLPRRVLDLDRVPDLSPIWRIDNHKCPGCDLCRSGPATLRPIQSCLMVEAERAGGALAPIAVGGGKELACMLLPDALHSKRAVILTKPRLKRQMLEVDAPRYGRHFRIPMDRITVVAYSELSSARHHDVLERIKPDLIIANECHQLRNKTAARTKRFLRFMKANPQCRFVGLSGTISQKSIKDYGHLSELSLRAGSPLPAGYRDLDEWSRVLDVAQVHDEDSYPMAAGQMVFLCGGDVFTEEYEALDEDEKVRFSMNTEEGPEVGRKLARRVYQRRFSETPGVVCSRASDGCAASLIVEARNIEVPDVIRDALRDLRRYWKVGDEELSEASQVAAKAKQLACGFYYRWAWPGGIKDTEWLQARSAWHSELRHIMRYQGGPGRDSPLQVINAIERGEIDSQSWEPWKALRDRPEPPTEAVWLSDFFLEDVATWAEQVKEDAPALIWYSHSCLAPRLEQMGLRVYYPGDDSLLQSRERVVVASINSYQDGLNLQHFSRMRITTPPANPTAYEQAIGRSHRPGQLADEVGVEIDTHDQSLRTAVAKAIVEAQAIEEREGQRQKLLLATRIGMEGFLDAEDVWESVKLSLD
jgi:hypothetical protein